MSNIAVSVKNLTKKFGDFTAVSNVTFDVEKGEIFGFLGANGAGKSTTIRMLCGILPPTSGTGIIAGYDVLKNPGMVRQNIGYMSQKFSLYDELTVYENMKFFAKLYSVSGKNINDAVNEAVEQVKLNGYEHVKTKSLSSGIKQRLSLACAIIHKPQIIFLDEPTSGVDPVSRRNFWDLIYNFASVGVTIFVTTHYMDEAEYCDRIAMISSGTLKEIGTPEELKTNKMIWNVYKIKGFGLYDVAQTILRMENVFDVGLLSDSIRILSSNLTPDDIMKYLDKNGYKGYIVEQAEAVLEDVFVSFAGGQNR